MKYLAFFTILLFVLFVYQPALAKAQTFHKPSYYCIGGKQGFPCITGSPSGTHASNTSPSPSLSITPSTTPGSECNVPSADIIFILDTSDSMGYNSGSLTKIQAAVIAMSSYMDILSIIPQPNNLKASLVTFAQNGEVDRHLTTNFQSIKNTIVRQAGDLTYRSCVQCGIDAAEQEIKNNSSSTNKIMVLVTDGKANWTEKMKPPQNLNASLGIPAALQAAINANKSSGVTLFTVGVGTPGKTANFSFLRQIANATGGKFFYVPSADFLKPTYQHIATVNKAHVQESAVNGTSLAACVTPTPTCPPGTTPASAVTIASAPVKQHMPHTHGWLQDLILTILKTLGLNTNSGNSGNTTKSDTTPLECTTPTPTPTDTPSPTPTVTPTPTMTPTPTPICKPPADFLMAMDVSQSMNEKSGNQKKITAAVTSINNFITAISQNPQDRASFITYSEKAQLVSPLTNNFAAVQSAVQNAASQLTPKTCTQCGIDALEHEEETNQLNQNKFAVLVTDGVANWTETSTSYSQTLGKKAAIQAAIAAHKKSGLIIYTIGVGTPGQNADFTFLNQIASATGGQFFSSPTANQLNAVYQQIAASIQYGGVCRGTPTPSPSISPTL